MVIAITVEGSCDMISINNISHTVLRLKMIGIYLFVWFPGTCRVVSSLKLINFLFNVFSFNKCGPMKDLIDP